jgi:hypothetical protein
VTSVINRYYDPATDQFLSIDPEVATTDQPYVFTNDDPLNATDPLGLRKLTLSERICIGLACAGIGAGIGLLPPLTHTPSPAGTEENRKILDDEKPVEPNKGPTVGKKGGGANIVQVTQSASMGPNQASSYVTLKQFEGTGGNPSEGGGFSVPRPTTSEVVGGGIVGSVLAFCSTTPFCVLAFGL